MTRRNAILVIADQKQFPPAVFLANRLVSLNSRPDIDVILATNSEQGLTEAKDFGAKFKLLNIRNLRNDIDLPIRDYFTKATYFRLFIPRLLNDQYDRILYLDVDTYPESANILALFDLNMGAYSIAAVRDLAIPFMQNPSNGSELTDTLRIPRERLLAAKYLNSGVLLIDLDAYKRDRIEKQALRLIREKRIGLRYLDQTILNAILRMRWLELSPRFNMTAPTWASFVRQFSPPVIVHFAGRVKPWHRAFVENHPIKREIAAFLKETPWSTFIAENNLPPEMIGIDRQIHLPPRPTARTPRWQGASLEALVRFLHETPFADVEQGMTVLNMAALPEIGK